MMWAWAGYLLILFGANVLGAVGGFGAGMISIPFLTQIFDAKLVIMASTVTCVLNIFIAVKGWGDIQWKKLGIITLFMCLGLPVGVWGLKSLSIPALKLVLGIFMMLLGTYGLCKLNSEKLAKKVISKPVLYICLLLGGIIQGAISSGGSLILLYAQQEMPEKKGFRATLALLWSVVSVITVAQYGYAGTLTGEVFAMSAVGAPAVMLGIYVGGILCRRLSQRMFQYIINILILVAGIINCVANG